jgi:preprotein translocase subunit SecA
MYENILIPVSDGKRVYNITCNLKSAYESEGKEIQKAFQKSILLYTIDEAWKEHLREMDELRQSVRNASYEQKDPLLIYKLESFGLFKSMVDVVNRKTVGVLMRGQLPVKEEAPVRQAAPERKQDFSKYRTQKDEFGDNSSNTAQQRQPEKRVEPVRVEKKVGRNDLCPCGSGQKFKNCHGKGQD